MTEEDWAIDVREDGEGPRDVVHSAFIDPGDRLRLEHQEAVQNARIVDGREELGLIVQKDFAEASIELGARLSAEKCARASLTAPSMSDLDDVRDLVKTRWQGQPVPGTGRTRTLLAPVVDLPESSDDPRPRSHDPSEPNPVALPFSHRVA
jgi:hypothetical protein